MASSGKTKNLQLNQWSLQDPVLMEDFNEDNKRTDAAVSSTQQAISSVPYVKLMDITTISAATVVEMDVSSIDLTQYGELIVYASSDGEYMGFNGSLTDYSTYNSFNGNWSARSSPLYICGGSAAIFTCGSNDFCVRGGYNYYRVDGGTKPKNLETIQFYKNSNGTTPIIAGSRYTLMGVKR